MSEVIGDTSDLHVNTIPFNAVHTLTGAHGSFAFKLEEASGLKHLLTARASVRIVSDSLTCQVIGPASAAKAVSAHVAVIPHTTNADDLPTTPAHVLTIGGSAFIQHSLYVGALPAPLNFAQEVAHQIKPTPILGGPPMVVGHYTVTGGVNTDTVFLRVSGVISVDGIGFVKPWST